MGDHQRRVPTSPPLLYILRTASFEKAAPLPSLDLPFAPLLFTGLPSTHTLLLLPDAAAANVAALSARLFRDARALPCRNSKKEVCRHKHGIILLQDND